ncbi:MAG: formate/nitrite transporter family protein [Treponema sp.]|nr:formate/nitrite transporter family protein [Treponema sp.]
MNTPLEIADIYIMVGDGKTTQRLWKLFLLGFLAGAYIGLGAMASQIVSYGVTTPGISRLLSAIVFPIGLVMIIIAGGELFTGNCLIFISVLSKNTYISAMLRTWLVIFLGNFVGAVFISVMVNFGHVLTLFDNKLAEVVVNTATMKVDIPFTDALIKGTLCNFMVCIAVWISFASDDIMGKILGLYLPIVLFVICGFEHSVANMYFVPAGIFAQHVYNIPSEALHWGSFLLRNLLPVTVGNIIGGSVMVGMGYWLIYLTERDD